MTNGDALMTPPATEVPGSSTAAGKRKRVEGATKEASTSCSNVKKARFASQPSPKTRSKKAKRANDWHLRKKDVDKEAAGTKAALELHIWALACLPHQNAVPFKVTNAEQAHFMKRFTSKSQIEPSVTASLTQNETNINSARMKMERLLSSLEEGSIISNNIKRVPECHLLMMFQTVANLGLEHWAPDILSSDPESLYNLLHEHIALKTFSQVSSAFGYSHMANNLSFVEDFTLMRKLYRSFIFSHFHRLAKLEETGEGMVAKKGLMTNIWKRRGELGAGRVRILKEEGFGARVVGLAEENEAHSDDELGDAPDAMEVAGPSTMSLDVEQVYYVKTKAGRSEKVTRFFREADKKRLRTAKSKKTQHRQERRRVEPNPPQDSKLTALPKRVSIDWFSPDHWNNELTLRERVDFINNKAVTVALPKAEFCTWERCREWKTLPEKEFMEKFGNDVLKEYNLPTEEEIKQLEMWDEEGEEEEVLEELEELEEGQINE